MAYSTLIPMSSTWPCLIPVLSGSILRSGFEDLRREMVMVAGAQSKVVILDCCYSGRAMAGGMSGSMEMADQARIDGTYLMTASAETVRAQAPVGEEFTAFTGELVTALSRGIPDGPDLLNIETLLLARTERARGKGPAHSSATCGK